MAKAMYNYMGLIFSLFNNTFAQEVTFGIPQHITHEPPLCPVATLITEAVFEQFLFCTAV